MSLLKALTDPRYWEEVATQGRNFGQATSNAVASLATAPVDLINMGLGFAGAPVSKTPVGGTEWLKQLGLYRDVPQGAAQVAGETLGNVLPVAIPAKAPQIANGLLQALANAQRPAQIGKQQGVIMSPFGRTPETDAERKYFAALLEKYADKGGFAAARGRSQSGNSQYVQMSSLDDSLPTATVRLSDHKPADAYIPSRPFFSVNTGDQHLGAAGGTFDEAVSWLSSLGYSMPRITADAEKRVQAGRQWMDLQRAAQAEEAARVLAQRDADLAQKASNAAAGKFEVEKTRTGYRATTADGRQIIVPRADVPESVKIGPRNALWEYIVNNAK